MRKLFIVMACLAAMTACKQEAPKQDDPRLGIQRDSLNQIIAQRDGEINDMMATLNDIEEGFREINAAEKRVAVAKAGEGANQKQRLAENIQFIQTTMRQNREMIAKLRKQLRESAFQGEEFKRTIDALTKQIEEKDAELTQLRAELAAKDIHIAELDNAVAELHTNVEQLKNEGEQKAQTISSQDKQLHTAYFVFGTKKELKEQRITDGSRVLTQNFNKSYFTKIDIRVDKEVKLYSKSAKLLTSHPASSYTLQPDASKQYILRITDPDRFWSASKYLVILVK